MKAEAKHVILSVKYDLQMLMICVCLPGLVFKPLHGYIFMNAKHLKKLVRVKTFYLTHLSS